MSNLVALCVSPPFETPGWKPLSIGISNGETMELSATNRFYAGTYVGILIVGILIVDKL